MDFLGPPAPPWTDMLRASGLELGESQQRRLVPTLAAFRRRLLEKERLCIQAAVAGLTAAAGTTGHDLPQG